jgi:hypothetical protein
MRTAIALIALLATSACDRIPDNSKLRGNYVGAGRDGLCIDAALGREDLHMGVVTYGREDANCTLMGDARTEPGGIMFYVDHDEACHFELQLGSEAINFPQRLPAACSYYCGPGASLSGKRFEKRPGAAVPTDFGGDPLC